MMNQIYKDLEQNVLSIYNHNILTINKYLHHSLNYGEVRLLIEKYKGNVATLQKSLDEIIKLYEVNRVTQKVKQPQFSRGQNPFAFFIDESNTFGQTKNVEVNPNQIYYAKDLPYLFDIAQKIEMAKLQQQAQRTGVAPTMTDVSYSSVLRALIEISKQEQSYAYLLQLIKESGFDIEKFIKDDQVGKTQNKPVIDELCTNLNELAKSGKLQKVIGRDDEIDQVINIISKARKNNPVLVGKAGVGKTAIAEGLAKRIVEGEVPESLKNAVIYSLEMVNLVKGTGHRGEFEQKASDLIEEIKEKNNNGQNVILFIDELHTIMGAGAAGQGNLDFANIMKPALARGDLRTIGATTTDEWHRFIKENAALDRRFVSVTVNEPNFEMTKKILEESLSFYEDKHGVKYDKGTIERAIELSKQFIIDNASPDKEFDLIDFAGARNNIRKIKTVSINDIEYSLAKHKNIDLGAIMNSKKKNLERISPKLKEVIFGQDEVVDKVSKTLEKVLAELNNPNKPYGAFLFTGPTGTGKTELSIEIAKVMNAKHYRIDCSELKEAHSVSKIIGSPAGYVGYDDGSSLTKVVNENPRMVLLLDEIEKAHPDVHKLFLQAMDYGKLTDSKGKEINFKNIIIIMTSNIGVVEREKRSIGLEQTSSVSTDMKAAQKVFLPEFMGRLTGNMPLAFNALNNDVYKKIVEKNVKNINENILAKKKITLKLSDNMVNEVVKHAKLINLGARPISEFLDNEVMTKLSDLVNFGGMNNLQTNKIITCDYQDGQIQLTH